MVLLFYIFTSAFMYILIFFYVSELNMDGGRLDMKQLLFNNLQLLGFDATSMEAIHHIPFNK